MVRSPAAASESPDLAAVPHQLADRRDDGGGAAREDLGDPTAGDALAPLVDRDLPLDDLVAHLAGELDDRRPGDALEDGAGLGGHDGAVVVDEVHVHAAELLDVLALLGVEEHHLVTAVAGGLLLGDQRARVVAAGLRRAHAAPAGARVVLGEPQGDRLDATLEVGAGRRRDHHERDVLCWADAEERLGGDHERPEVEALLALGTRHPALVHLDERVDGLDEVDRVELWEGQPRGRPRPSAWRSPRDGTSRWTRRRAGRPSSPRRSPARSAGRPWRGRASAVRRE